MQAPSEALFLAQIVLLLLVGRLMGEAMLRIGQPAVMGQLFAGILLGPSCSAQSGPRHNVRLRRRSATEKHDRCRFAAWHPDAVAADWDGDRPQAG